jgi:DNA polymerase IV
MFGRHGLWLWQLANGQDDRPVEPDHGPPKTISHERTFARDIADGERAMEVIRDLAQKVADRAEKKRLVGRSVTLKIRWFDFQLMTRQQLMAEPTANADAITASAGELLTNEVVPLLGVERAIRLLGVALGGITPLDAPEMVVPSGRIIQLPLWERAAS